MNKLFGLALAPVLLSATIGLASAEPQQGNQAVQPEHRMNHEQMVQKNTHQSTTRVTRTESRTRQESADVKDNANANQAVSNQMRSNRMQTAISPQMRRQLLNGQVNLISRHYPEAIEAFHNALGADDNNVSALNGLAQSYQAQGRYTEALQTINRGIALDPVNSQLYLTKGQIQDADGQPLAAVESYLTFTAQTPDDGAALETNRRVEELYKIVQPKLSESVESYLQGLRMLSLNQPEQAIPLFEKYQTLEPNSQQAHLLLGRAYLAAGQPDSAIQHFEAAVQLQSDNPAAYYQLGSSYALKGESKNASDAFRKFLQFAPQSEAAVNINRRFDINQP
jgi:tetratricopeptide (TPR) repeat protein